MTQHNEENIHGMLDRGAKAMGIALHQKQKEKLLAYICLLEKWNKAYNLSAIRNKEEMVSKHLLDSLAVFPLLASEKITTLADLGSGAGLPGIPLAIVCPQWQIALIESSGKKAGFLRQAKTQLRLDNVVVVNERVEDLDQSFDAVICRAFSSMKEMTEVGASILNRDTVLWFMKGKYPDGELRELPKPYMVSASYALVVPGCEGERHLLKVIHE